jgi:transcription elongation factor Elf1
VRGAYCSQRASHASDNRRTVETVTVWRVLEALSPADRAGKELQHVCEECGKCFNTAQGVRTHIHMMHELKGHAPVERRSACPRCGKQCAGPEALEQHILHAHTGRYTHVRRGRALDAPQALHAVHCGICGLGFECAAELDVHMSGFAPADMTTAERICEKCARVFQGQRALLQHANHCEQGNS